MLRSLGGFLCACALVLAAAIAPAHAGMQNDLALCTAAEGRPSAAACTRVMNSGRLRDEDIRIGYYNRADSYEKAGDFDKATAAAKEAEALAKASSFQATSEKTRWKALEIR